MKVDHQRAANENLFVADIVAQIRAEEALCSHELRADPREKVVLPALIYDLDGNEVSGFTRDLSVSGVSIISNWQFHSDETWKIALYRLDGSSSAFYCECRWSQSFGNCFWISGWKFLCPERS